MYDVLEISLGNLSRLYQYKQKEFFGADLNIKGFDYPWLLASRQWKSGERVLDVGAGYSLLPMHLQETYGCEVWVADDYGLQSGQPFWQRGQSPEEHVGAHPSVKFVLERLGDPSSSSLPTGYFDVIYSLSALEHVRVTMVPDVWRHMDLLLKPGGEMLHAIDIPFPSNQGWRKVLAGEFYDRFFPLFPQSFHLPHYMATPKAHARLVARLLGISEIDIKGLSVTDMVFNPDVLTEGYEIGLNRILKDGLTDFQYRRAGTLLFHLKKHTEPTRNS
ncbi:MAG: class I SAM-dependent methyltransferase [Anaerolineales bacterium]|nr:class I SAM-dependent methyltransferase [Anaerolineales bacterium]